jgi:trehalose synthase-fused probable maltokinase
MDHLDPAWLRSQRWFRSKQRVIDAVGECDRVPLPERGALVVVQVTYLDDGPVERYLVPIVDGREPADGDGVWRSLATLITSGATLAGDHGAFEATPVGDADGDRAGDERRLLVEQSNTSVVLGERSILKLYRLLETGANPDVEVSAFLTRAGFVDTPAVAGSLSYVDGSGTGAAAAMLQAYVPSRGDGWAATLAALATDPAAAVQIAVAVGSLTRRLHLALAAHDDDEAFPSRAASADDVTAWRASAEHQLQLAVQATDGDQRARLIALTPAVRARFEAGFEHAAGTPVSRIHGDYHLGQLLARVDGGFSVIDFEGEPARPLAERRQPASPLRDVAGMMRSLDYAARTAGAPPTWLAEARAGLLAGYGAVGGSEHALVDVFELEKACYEVRYEAGNRPHWLPLPLDAVARLARQD